MQRATKRKAMIGGSTLIVAGALAGVFTFSAGGQNATTHPGAAGHVQAQRVDIAEDQGDDVTPSARPATGTPGHIDIRVRNSGDRGGTVCVNNGAHGPVCTPHLDGDNRETSLHADIVATDSRADVAVTIDHDSQSTENPSAHLQLPVDSGEQCLNFDNEGVHEPLDCSAF